MKSEPSTKPLTVNAYANALIRRGATGVFAFLKQYRLLVYPGIGVVSLDNNQATSALAVCAGVFSKRMVKAHGYYPEFSAHTKRVITEEEHAQHAVLPLNNRTMLCHTKESLYDDLVVARSNRTGVAISLSALNFPDGAIRYVRTREAAFLLKTAGFLPERSSTLDEISFARYPRSAYGGNGAIYILAQHRSVTGHLFSVNLDDYTIEGRG